MDTLIDVVVPFVDNTDPLWQRIYIEYCNRVGIKQKLLDMKTERYEDNVGLINYQLKLINKNMPWVNKIYLLLMNREQAPKDLPNNVQIVYHGAFIPQTFLPTFNSTTIEMFIWKIKDLSEHFIYMNDDMLPIKPLQQSDFFTEDNKIKIEWWKEDITEIVNTFRYQCFNSYKHMAIRLGIKTEKNKYERPAHSFTPMIKSHCFQAYKLLEDVITKHIRAFRTEYQYNQYIYPIFEKFYYGTCDSDIDFLYTQLKDGIDLDHQIVCFNVVPQKYVSELKKELDKLV